MTSIIDDVVTQYLLSSHPRNRAIVDIKSKKSNELQYIKIRHRLTKFYSVSLVNPINFEVMAEVQANSATAKIKPIMLRNENGQDIRIEIRDTSKIGFEWCFVWEGEKYKWVRESRMSKNLECKAIRKKGDICVAQYLPRGLKDEYFGMVSILGYNMLRCELSQTKELELILFMSLITLLDKSDDRGWKRDSISRGIQESVPSPAISEQVEEKKKKIEHTNDQKLNLMLEKDLRRSHRQIQRYPSSTGSSPIQTPQESPLPTPTVSSGSLKQKTSPMTKSNSTKRISKIFNSLLAMNQQQQMKIKEIPIPSPPIIDKAVGWDHQLTFPYGSYSPYTRMANEIGYMSIHRSSEDEKPPNVKSIQWEPDPLLSFRRALPVPDLFHTQRYNTVNHPHPYNNRYSTSEYHTQLL
ncbi:hypothetical protein BY458DRAFT_482722 [Sporodiniella umbellata]|nr:hypothetical protein BY458DRAFT_482722 [Sporodiniella umbellata]